MPRNRSSVVVRLARDTTAGAALCLGAAFSIACAGRVPPPAATPTAEATVLAPDREQQVAGGAPVSGEQADARFVQLMILHHAQALTMSNLVTDRTGREDMLLLAERIRVSQQDEIALMTRWLRSRGHDAPDPVHAHHHPAHGRMAGMATEEQLRQLAAARGTEFDQLFLTLMIRHHEGALEMVADLLAAPGGGQDSELYRMAADIDADQRTEIARMRGMLAAMSRQE